MVRFYILKFLITFTVTLCSNFNLVMFKVCSQKTLQSCRFCATSVSVGPLMSQYLFSSVPVLSFICELDGFEHVDNSL